MNILKDLRAKKGVLQKDVANFLQIDRTTYVKYENGDSEPNLQMLQKIADYFDTSVDYILGRKEKTATQTEAFSILNKYSRLNNAGKEKTEAYIDDLLENPKYRNDILEDEDGLKYTNVTFEDNKVRIAAFGGGVKDDDDEETYTT